MFVHFYMGMCICTHVSGHRFILVYLGFFHWSARLYSVAVRKMLSTELGHLFSFQKPVSIIISTGGVILGSRTILSFPVLLRDWKLDSSKTFPFFFAGTLSMYASAGFQLGIPYHHVRDVTFWYNGYHLHRPWVWLGPLGSILHPG